MEKQKKPTHLILDVDGVLTTGQFFYSADNGKYTKVFGPHDGDGIKVIRKYLTVEAITADRRGFEISKRRVEIDMKIPLTIVSEENRMQWMKDTYDLKSSVFMGDGIFDAYVFENCLYGIAPQNAFYIAKEKADYVTTLNSGEGAVAEACFHILENFFGITLENYYAT